MSAGRTVLVLGGGPDAEREVSLASSQGVAGALAGLGDLGVHYEVIDRPTPEALALMPGDVVFPVLHGVYGEGGPLQDLLEADGRPYVGCRPAAARLAMDKVATKLAAARVGLATAPCAVLNRGDRRPPIPLPVVVKPVHEGSSVGVHVCATDESWDAACGACTADAALHQGRVYMVERLIRGREVTVGVIGPEGGLEALAPVEIRAASGVYDYEAKYARKDTRYVPDPDLPEGVTGAVLDAAVRVAREIGVRHLCRVDFVVDDDRRAWLLEVNTMPGFTPTSLLPMSASARGIGMPELCARLVAMALED